MSRERKKLSKRELDAKVLAILAGQSKDYLIQPHATAFLIEGLTPAEVEESLLRHLKAELVDHITTTEVEISYDDDGTEIENEIADEDGRPIIINQGFKINRQGKFSHREYKRLQREAKKEKNKSK